MIEYVSYERVNDLYFGDSPERAIDIFGEPELKDKNNDGILEFYYPNKKTNRYMFKIIFDQDYKFSNFLLYPQTELTVNGKAINWNLESILDIINLDSNPRMDYYDITLYDVGVSFGDFKPKYLKSNGSINFFRKGELDEFRDGTEPFNKAKYLKD